MNIRIEDIKEIENKLGLRLSEEQRDNVLMEYQRLVLDRGESWDIILKGLITNIK